MQHGIVNPAEPLQYLVQYLWAVQHATMTVFIGLSRTRGVTGAEVESLHGSAHASKTQIATTEAHPL